MKINDKIYKIMKDAISLVIDYVGKEKVKKAIEQRERFTMWEIWNRASDDLQDADSHPRFKRIKRIVPYTGFYVYSEDSSINDNHIETALKKIFKELL